jgi:hypothetical protein
LTDEQQLIHILRSHMNDSLRAALSDFVSLSGVMTEFSSADFWRDTERVLETLRLLDLILQATLYKGEWQLRDDDAIAHRYNRLYGQAPLLNVKHFLNVCRKYNWITSTKNPPLRLQSTGKRMIGHLFRIANDAFAYHLQPEDQQALYQAIRDAKLGEAYEDEGIGGGEVLASMISNLEDASGELELSIQRYIYEGKGIQKVKEIGSLLDQVKNRLETRFEKSAELIPDNQLQLLSERAHRAFADAHSVSYLVLGQTAISSLRRQEKRITHIDVNQFLRYLSDCAQLEFRDIDDRVGLIDLMVPLDGRVMRLLQVRSDEAFKLFIKKADHLIGDLLKIVYDEEQEHCMAMTRLVQSTARYVLNDFDLALLLYLFYCERVAGFPYTRFETILRQFEHVDLINMKINVAICLYWFCVIMSSP